MKKILTTGFITIVSVLSAIAQPLPNQNPHGATGAGVNNQSTSGSISTLSVDHNEMLMIGLSILAVTALYFVSKRKSVKA